MSASVAEQPYAPRLALCSDCERNLSPPTATGLDLFLIRPAVGTALAQPAVLRLEEPAAYPVGLDPELYRLKERLISRARAS